MIGLEKARTLILALVLAAVSVAVFAQNKVVVIPIVDEGVNATSIWLPAADAVLRFGTLGTLVANMRVHYAGETCVTSESTGPVAADLIFPVQISVPVGRNSRITAATIYYKADDSAAFIDSTTMQGRDFKTGEAYSLFVDENAHDSTSFDSYTIAVTDNGNVTSIMAPMTVKVRLRMNAGGSRVCFFGVSLELG